MKQRGPILWKQIFSEAIMPIILLGKTSLREMRRGISHDPLLLSKVQ